MRIEDQIAPVTGHFRLEVRRAGEVVEVVDEPNLVVVGSKTCLSRLVGGAVTGKQITTIGFGTSGTAPASGNTALTGAFTKAVDSVSYPASNQVRFAFSLSSSEANGMAILEFGLLTGDSTLFARKVRSSAFNKDSDVSVAGTWTLTF